ncbi:MULTISPECIES: 6-phosphofructokinase [unclassified Microbacterium]|uniref:6-phosphofructokinase n=1 Tax=unclassified Microbacterium TaxID=2609290 RepID=UPI00097E8B8F|nr:6-phosphofructokinase [Microbacterium sp. JB110]RCS59000.1 ATP-dependent 6-phosphofructokinase [Microbacterium sp. JB110]SJM68136.1 6-phosphofructokinase [Frigoribacterium sp. JB110]
MKIGILTSGGDCPGLNAVIRGAVLNGTEHHGIEFVGIRDGWKGLVEGDFFPLTRHQVKGLSKVGGTILGTSRTNPYDGERGGPENIAKTLYGHHIDGVIAIGGEGTLAAAQRLANDGINVLGVPKTIDNDLRATDYSFGFDTAVNIATEAMDRLRTTGDSHQRCMVAEVMGRHVGWIALHSGMAAGAHIICIPEVPLSLEEICDKVNSAAERGRAPLVVVAEGFKLIGQDEAYSDKGLDAFNRPRLGGISEVLAPEIERVTGIETRSTVLGHIQRGGAPSGFDRVLATRLGLHAVDAIVDGEWGQMVAMQGTEIVRVPFSDALGELNTVPIERYEGAATLFG